jgi:hypothetical protein
MPCPLLHFQLEAVRMSGLFVAGRSIAGREPGRVFQAWSLSDDKTRRAATRKFLDKWVGGACSHS